MTFPVISQPMCPLRSPGALRDVPCSAWPMTKGWAVLGQPLSLASSPLLPWLRPTGQGDAGRERHSSQQKTHSGESPLLIETYSGDLGQQANHVLKINFQEKDKKALTTLLNPGADPLSQTEELNYQANPMPGLSRC